MTRIVSTWHGAIIDIGQEGRLNKETDCYFATFPRPIDWFDPRPDGLTLVLRITDHPALGQTCNLYLLRQQQA